MNSIIPFKFKNAPIRVIKDEQGEPWFIAKDVAELLGYKRTADAVRAHCKGVGEIQTPIHGVTQTVKIIPERDVYRLIMRSKLPSAEAFEEWVVGEVLPSIRRTGSYRTEPANTIAVDQNEYIELLRAQIFLLKGERPQKPQRAAPLPLSDDEKLHILELHEQGLGKMDIARQLGRSRSAVRSVIRELAAG